MRKKCSSCGRTKDETEFNWCSAKHEKRSARCKVCKQKYDKRWVKKNPKKRAIVHRRSKEKRKRQDITGYRRSQRNTKLKLYFGITIEQYDAMVVAQDGKCAICGRPEIRQINGKLADLAVDHDHQTGKIRALLCSSCNTGIGNLGDSPFRLRKAAAYLDYHK